MGSSTVEASYLWFFVQKFSILQLFFLKRLKLKISYKADNAKALLRRFPRHMLCQNAGSLFADEFHHDNFDNHDLRKSIELTSNLPCSWRVAWISECKRLASLNRKLVGILFSFGPFGSVPSYPLQIKKSFFPYPEFHNHQLDQKTNEDWILQSVRSSSM